MRALWILKGILTLFNHQGPENDIADKHRNRKHESPVDAKVVEPR
jgi:hypothetical protein